VVDDVNLKYKNITFYILI